MARKTRADSGSKGGSGARADAEAAGDGTLLIPRPLDVDAAIRKVKRGQVVTQREIRSHLARECGADEACPITTGIFVRIAAEASAEEERSGKRRVTPWWRVVGDGGRLMEKLPGGVEEQARRLWMKVMWFGQAGKRWLWIFGRHW